MDERFPKFLRFLVRKLDFLGLPNLGTLIAALAVLGFVGKVFLGAPVERFVFDPFLVMQGEWWRLFAYPISESLSDPIWLIFFVLYIYFVLNSLEAHWGPGPLTLFTGLSYIATIGAAFAAGRAVNVWLHVIENISLAFGTLFPEVEFYLFFILPIRAKWLALFAGAILLIQFVLGSIDTKLFLAISLSPYLLFFSKILYSHIRLRIRMARSRNRWKGD